MKKKENKKIYLILFSFISLFMCIGYAAVNSIVLDITGTANANIPKEIYIKAVNVIQNEEDSNDDDASAMINLFDGTFLSSTINLPDYNQNAFITYEITITNDTEYDQMFRKVEYTLSEDSYDNENIVFDELNGLSVGDVIQPQASVTFTMTFHYKDYALPTEYTLNSNLNFLFMKSYAGESIFNMMKEQAYLDNTSSRFVSNPQGIDFSRAASDDNGKGIYMMSDTAEDENPKYMDTTRNTNNEKNYHILYKDNEKIKIYDVESKTSTILSLSAKFEQYELIYDNITNKIYGVAYYSDIIKGTSSKIRNTSGFYNVKNGRILYKNLFDEIYFVNESKIAGKDNIDTGTTNHELLSNTKEQTYLKITGKNNEYFELDKNNKNYILYKNNQEKRNIYTLNGKIIAENLDYYMYIFDSSDNITIINNKKVEKYTPNGTKVAESKQYDNVLQLVGDLFIVSLNGKLVITNFNDLEVILGPWLDHYTYFITNSGYLKGDKLCNGMEEGIYVAIDNKTGGIMYYYNPETEVLKELPLPHTSC